MDNNKYDAVKFTNLDLLDPSVMDFAPYKQRRTPIVVTLNNSKITPVDIQKLMEAGMNVARFKMSTSTKGEKMRMLGQVDKAALNCCRKYSVKNWPVATCVDLKTCVVKTGLLEEEVNSIPIHEGKSIILTYNSAEFDSCTEEKIFVDNPYLASEVKVGMEISIGEDEILLQCTEIVNNTSIKCIVSKGGNLSNLDNVSVRGAKRNRPVLNKRDFEIIRFALKYQVDMLIINYVRDRNTLIEIKRFIGKKVKRPLLISGICTQDGLNNIDDIALESDAILLPRDFLPYELEPSKRHKLSQIQKWLGAKCQSFGKPFYISGGVFQDSLINGEYSDREVSDVTNALLDGANAFILKDCNNMENVIETIKSLNDLCCTIEPYTNSSSGFWRITDEVKMPLNAAEACMLSCAAAANQAQAKVIVMPTVTGCTAKALLRMRPACLVMTVSTKPEVTRLLNTLRCVVPLMYTGSLQGKWHINVGYRVNFAIEYAVKRGWLTYGDSYVTLQRASEESSFCDCVRIWTVAISKKALVECPE